MNHRVLPSGVRENLDLWKVRIEDHVGRRGTVLLVLGLVWVVVGVSIPGAPEPQFEHVHEMLGDPTRVALWAVPGLVAIYTALAGKDHSDVWAFRMLIAAPAIRAASYLWSWFLAVVPPPFDGDPRGWSPAAVWLLVTVLVRTIAGWRNPPTKKAASA